MFNLRYDILKRLCISGIFCLWAIGFAFGTPGCSKNEELKQEIFRLRETVAELNRNVTDAHVRLEDLDNRLHILQATVEREKSDEMEIPAHLRKVKLVPEEPKAVSEAAPQPPEPQTKTVPYYKMVGSGSTSWKTTPKQDLQSISERYQDALHLYRTKKYNEAVTAFDRFAKNPETNEYTDNAVFWSGVCRYEQRQFADAILRFQHLIKMPKSNKKADGLYYLGLSYEALGDTQTAGKTWKKLTDDFPDSEAARKVRRSLSTKGKGESATSLKNNES